MPKLTSETRNVGAAAKERSGSGASRPSRQGDQDDDASAITVHWRFNECLQHHTA